MFRKGEGGERVRGTLKEKPFAEGGYRYAYYGLVSEGLPFSGRREGRAGEAVVMKHLKDVYEEGGEEVESLRESVVVHMLGIKVVEEFNRVRPGGCPKMSMVRCELLESDEGVMVSFFFFFFFFF